MSVLLMTDRLSLREMTADDFAASASLLIRYSTAKCHSA